MKDIKIAAKIIRNGGVVVFPTETVYGIGANAFDADACRKIFRIKNRPARNPLIVHISDLKMLKKVVRSIPPVAKILIDNFWPGPLTIVFKKKKTIPLVVSGGLKTVAVRMPSDKIARSLIKLSGVPIAAPSANISGYVSPTHESHILDDYSHKKNIDMILAGGRTRYGIESTIIDVTKKSPIILRQGIITLENIEKVLGQKIKIASGGGKILSPGMLKKHYSPRAPFYFFENLQQTNSFILKHSQYKIGILVNQKLAGKLKKSRKIHLRTYRNTRQLSKNLYKWLREFDKRKLDFIVAMRLENRGLGRTINDRFQRASVKS